MNAPRSKRVQLERRRPVYARDCRLESQLNVSSCRNAVVIPARSHLALMGRVSSPQQQSDRGATTMSLAETRSDATVEECLDELNDFVTGLQRYSPTVIAVALRVHLGTLLQALLEGEMCTREEVRDFVKELERDARQEEED